jgi:hypothetical protein
MPDPWHRLGIARTNDVAVIRATYAALLKKTRPDVDPDGFRSLREAFEAARRWAEQNWQSGGTPVALVREPPPDSGVRDRIIAALEAGRLVEAAETWRAGLDNGQLSFRDEDHLSLQLARRCGPPLEPAMLAQIAELMGWQEVGKRYGAPQPILDVLARHAAEQWMLDLRGAAAGPFRWRRKPRALRRAARLLLKPAPGPVAWHFPYAPSSPDFRPWLAEWERHRPVLGDRIDPRRLAWCRASMTRTDARLVAGLWRLLVFFFALQMFVTLLAAIGGIFAAFD